jgi:asparagine N-glycosylation enzyme membrane subunit Stt3
LILRASFPFSGSPDCVYHLRRAVFALRHFPSTIIFDPLMNFPAGGICIWPPLFDLALALPARLFGGAGAPLALLERTSAFVPLVFAAGAIGAAALVGTAASRRFGAAAAMFLALAPAHIQYSQLGHTDQHVAESFWGFLALGCFLGASRRKSAGWETAAGVALFAATLTWQGGIFWAPLFGAAIAAASARRPDPRAIRTVTLMLGVPSLGLALATAFFARGLELPFTYVSFGWFQPAFLLFTFAVTLLAVTLLTRRVVSRRTRVLALVATGATGVALIPVAVKLADSVVMGLRHLASQSTGFAMSHGGLLSYPREWLAQIQEYRPLLADRWDWPIVYLSIAFFLSPIVIGIWTRRFFRGPQPQIWAALAISGSFLFLWTLAQRRNIYYGALMGALTAVELSAQAATRLTRRLPRTQRRIGRPALFCTVFAAFLAPMILGFPAEIRSGYEPPAELLATFRKLSTLMPQVIDPFDPRMLDPAGLAPELARAESVMAFWSEGHLVTWFSGRPVVANNFGYGYFDSLRFFLAESDAEAFEIARRRRVRFIVSMDLFPIMNSYGAQIRRGPYFIPTAEGLRLLPAYARSFTVRLHEFDGRGGDLGGLPVMPIDGVELRYASREGVTRLGRFIPRWKIFEIRPSKESAEPRPPAA